ncbi:putative membrane protein [Labrenzia sp. EL_195]|nr:putative membrane protein [Labrenzia sp. EL_195]
MSRNKHKSDDTSIIGHRPGAATRLRNYFLTGLVITGPIGITLWLTWTFIKWVDGWVKPFVPKVYNPETYLPFPVPGFGLIVAIFVLTIVGFLAANFLGRSMISFGEGVVGRMPLVRNIYSGLKQIFETVLDERGNSFTKAALVQYPRKGLWAIVFISTETKGEVAKRLKDTAKTVSVFLPTTPNPTSGFLLFVPKEDIIELSMGVEDAAKLVISAGLVSPDLPDILEDVIAEPEKLEEIRNRETA